jgi:hypothetical protein
MFGILLHEYSFGNNKVTRKLYHKIYASKEDVVKGINNILIKRVNSLNNSSRYTDGVECFAIVDRGYHILDVKHEFDQAIIFVDGKDGIHSENDASIYPVVTASFIEFTGEGLNV